MTLEEINEAIRSLPEDQKELVSDGYHTFKELYDARLAYNAALFNQWATHKERDYVPYEGPVFRLRPKYDIHKSLRHHDGELCFGGDWFIVVAILPTGQISQHYHVKHWDLFRIPEVEKAKHPFDGHGTQDVFERLIQL